MEHQEDIRTVNPRVAYYLVPVERVQFITTMELGFSNLTLEDISSLVFFLKRNQTVTILNLYGNHINPKGAKVLREALEINDTLTSLDLHNNNLDDEGVKEISEALKINHALTMLYLHNNNISDKGAKKIAKAIKVNCTLTSLCLGSYIGKNEIGDKGAEALSKALKSNRTLTNLSLAGNKITALGREVLNKALKENGALTSLNLKGNIGIVDTEDLDIIQEKFEKNSQCQAQFSTDEESALCEISSQSSITETTTTTASPTLLSEILAATPNTSLTSLSEMLALLDFHPWGVTPYQIQRLFTTLAIHLFPAPVKQLSDQLTILTPPIANGEFSKVSKGKWQGKKVACKHFERKLENCVSWEFKKEINLLRKLNCPYIVHFYGTSMLDKRPLLVMEFCPNGTLLQTLENDDDIPSHMRVRWGEKIALGLSYLHCQKIVHSDLAARNILLDKEWNPKLTGFGLLKTEAYYRSKNPTTSPIQSASLAWRAPEQLLNPHARPTYASDMYSYGVVLWEIVSRTTPLQALSHLSLDKKVNILTHEGYYDEIPEGTPEEFANLITECQHVIPEKRPSAEEAAKRLKNYSLKFFPSGSTASSESITSTTTTITTLTATTTSPARRMEYPHRAAKKILNLTKNHTL